LLRRRMQEDSPTKVAAAAVAAAVDLEETEVDVEDSAEEAVAVDVVADAAEAVAEPPARSGSL